MSTPSIRFNLLWRCGIGVGVLLCLLSVSVYFLVQRSLFQQLDESVSQTAALLSNLVELEDESITFEWQEGIGTNQGLIDDGLFQFWEINTGVTTRSPGIENGDLPRFTGTNGRPERKSILLPDRRRARAVGLRIHPFVDPVEMALMKERGRVIDPKTMPFVLVVARDAEPTYHTLEDLRWVLASGSLLTIGLGFLLIDRVIGVTLRPIDELASQIQNRTTRQLDSALEVPENLPAELVPLAENFDCPARKGCLHPRARTGLHPPCRPRVAHAHRRSSGNRGPRAFPVPRRCRLRRLFGNLPDVRHRTRRTREAAVLARAHRQGTGARAPWNRSMPTSC